MRLKEYALTTASNPAVPPLELFQSSVALWDGSWGCARAPPQAEPFRAFGAPANGHIVCI